MTYYDTIRAILALPVTSSAKIILIYLYDRQGENSISWPKFDTIQKDCSICRDTIQRSIEQLEKSGLLEVDREHRNNRYVVKINSLKTRPVRKPDQSENQTLTVPKSRPKPCRKADSNGSSNGLSNDPVNIYGEFVKLSDSEFKNLVFSLGLEKTQEMIEALNNYIGSKGKRYKSHYHTILNWIRREEKGLNHGRKTTSTNQPKHTDFANQQSTRTDFEIINK